MTSLRTIKYYFKNNIYIFYGFFIGILLSVSFQENGCDLDTINDNAEELQIIENNIINTSQNLAARSVSKARPGPLKIVRPRYYSTELGIKEKLFIGVFTSIEKIEYQAININKTVAHLVDKIKFFITASNKFKNKMTLSGIVGFTDTREKYRPFQVIKYVSDSFLQSYDYFFFVNDFNYVNARRLKHIVNKISVKEDVYMGIKESDSSFCSFNAGILLSNSVLKSMKDNLEWCVKNIVSDDHTANIGRCISHSMNIDCQNDIQSQMFHSYQIKHYNLEKHISNLIQLDNFNNAVTVYPILHQSDIFLLHAYFSRQFLTKLHKETTNLGIDLVESWPPGQRPGNKPATRFDLPIQHYFNTTHIFFPDDFTNIAPFTTAEKEDIKRVLEAVKSQAISDVFKFRRLVNGYRIFDLSRGMDYYIDLGFKDTTTGKEVIRRFHVCKPLGKVELLTVPYVTENIKVTIILPIEETQIDDAQNFIGMYVNNIVDRREKSFLLLVFLYDYNAPSKGENDIFKYIKNLALQTAQKNRNENAKIAWLSIRLPALQERPRLEKQSILNYAVIDLALRKIGLESLVLVLDVHCDIKYDLLNRVRMNTIANFQIFNAIPFRQYDPSVSKVDVFEVHKSVGHFDKNEYKYVSFYAKDYVNARKLCKDQVPIVKNDGDIQTILEVANNSGNIFEMFLKYSENIHCMRATDMSLKIKHYSRNYNLLEERNLFIGSKTQLAQTIISSENL